MYSEITFNLIRDEAENESFIRISGNLKNMPEEKKAEFKKTINEAICLVFGLKEEPKSEKAIKKEEPVLEVEDKPLITNTEQPEVLKDNKSNEVDIIKLASEITVAYGKYKKSPITIKNLFETDKKGFEFIINGKFSNAELKKGQEVAIAFKKKKEA